MTTTSTIEPGLGDNWSSFGAIIIVSVLGPVLTLLLSIAPVVVVELVSVFLDFSFCKHVDTCAPGGSGNWSAWLINESYLLYVFWVTLATGFACVATLESAFYIFRRAAPIPVVGWHAALMFVLVVSFPVDSLRSLLSPGWAGIALASMHYYLCYRELPLYQPPKADAAAAPNFSGVSQETPGPIKIPGGLGPSRRRALQFLALYTCAILGVAYYFLVKDKPVLFVTFCGLGLYSGIVVLHRAMSLRNDPTMTIGRSGLDYLGQSLPWREIGRVWIGADGYRHIVMIETPAATAQRMLQATAWINRLFAKANVARDKVGTAVHAVVIDTRFMLAEAAELVQAIEAHRPPGSRWMPAADTS